MWKNIARKRLATRTSQRSTEVHLSTRHRARWHRLELLQQRPWVQHQCQSSLILLIFGKQPTLPAPRQCQRQQGSHFQRQVQIPRVSALRHVVWAWRRQKLKHWQRPHVLLPKGHKVGAATPFSTSLWSSSKKQWRRSGKLRDCSKKRHQRKSVAERSRKPDCRRSKRPRGGRLRRLGGTQKRLKRPKRSLSLKRGGGLLRKSWWNLHTSKPRGPLKMMLPSRLGFRQVNLGGSMRKMGIARLVSKSR
mmetsp:Transcript_140310/g.349782  ORF Transcript_140310/g.349782 Transcript_140310/m.349782 type:complete len:248 (-) Transcript_140310:2969-3712(-)